MNYKEIKVIMLRKEITPGEVAARADLSKDYISRLVNGKANPTMETLEKVAGALEMDLPEFLSALAIKEGGGGTIDNTRSVN